MQQIADWLRELGMSEYSQRFADNDIDVDALRDLTDRDLKDLGVSLGHRRKMLRAIRDLFGASVAAATDGTATGKARQEGAERRQLTVMFCDLVGSTALSTRLDPEDLRCVIGAYHKRIAETIARFDGFVAKYMGDGALMYFGYPHAHEDDAERAVRAGLDIITGVGELRASEPLNVRIGIATGLVVVGDLIGEGAAREQSVVGGTPNLAARLQALAEPGTMVVAASTRRLLGDLFKFRELEPSEVKGFANPVNAWGVEGLLDSESRFEAVRTARLTGFVGRDGEIGLLLEKKGLAWNGAGQVVLVSGEPGIGKSRIAAALSARISSEPHTRLRYQCSPYHKDSALHPFIGQLGRAAELNPNDPPERQLDRLEAVLTAGTSRVEVVAPLFAALVSIPFAGRYPPLVLSPAQQRRQTFAALLDQLEGLARRQPVLLLFEDLQWADPTSVELLDAVVDRLRYLPVLAILTFRPEFEPAWLGLPNVTTLSLGRLGESHVEAIAEQVANGRRLPTPVMKQIVGKTDGIPLFAEELTKAVLEADLLVEDIKGYRLTGPLPPLAIPSTLHDSLMARLDRLAPVKEIAQVGAAIGREFSYALLKTVVGREESALRIGLDQLEQAGVVSSRGELPHTVYIFKHALVQDAAYESLLRSRRQSLHQRIAEALRDRFPALADTEPEIVAHHFTQSGLAEAAVKWWGKAGERSLQRAAHDEAVAHLRKALGLANTLSADSLDQDRLRLRLQIACGNALLQARGFSAPETTAAFAQAAKIATKLGDPVARISANYGMWTGSYTRGAIKQAQSFAEEMLHDGERVPESPEGGIAHRVFGTTCWSLGNFETAQRHFERALAAYDEDRDRALAFRFGADPGVSATIWQALALWSIGEVSKAGQFAEAAAVNAERTDHVASKAYFHGHKAILDLLLDDTGALLFHVDTLIGLSIEHGLRLWLAGGKFLLSLARAQCHDDRRCAEISKMRESLAWFRKMNFNIFVPLFGARLAAVESEAGHFDEGIATLDTQLAMIEQSGERWIESELHRVRGNLCLQRNPCDTAMAESAYVHAINTARSQKARVFELRAAMGMARLWSDQGKQRQAHDLLASVYGLFAEGFDTLELKGARALLERLKT